MALDLLGLEYKYVEVAVLDGATRTLEYLSMNPQHTVPVLTDGNLVVTESRAAMTYLVSQHKPGQLYPACAKKRSQIDQRLYFKLVLSTRGWATVSIQSALARLKLFPRRRKKPLKRP